jgi:2-methylcitrate dehydratase
MCTADSALPAGTGEATGQLLLELAAFAVAAPDHSESAGEAARCTLLDALATLFEGLADPHRARLLGPLVPGATLPGGARIPGTPFELEPSHAAFNLAVLLHRSAAVATDGSRQRCDSLAAILAVADYQARLASLHARPGPLMGDVFTAMLKAQAIQAALAGTTTAGVTGDLAAMLAASAAMSTWLLGGSTAQVGHALGSAWVQLHGITRRAGPAASSDVRIEAGEAAARAVRHALFARRADHLADRQPAHSGTPARAWWVAPATAAPVPAAASSLARLAGRVVPLLGETRAAMLLAMCNDAGSLWNMPVDGFVALTIH